MNVSKLAIALTLSFLLVARATAAGEDDAQQKAEAILHQADTRMASLHDFRANLKARAHFPLLPAVSLTGHLYFKRPNHLKVDVENLPRIIQKLRQNMQVQAPYHNRKAYVARYLRTETVDGQVCDVIGFSARDAVNRLQSATLWVERANGTMPRSVLQYADGSECTMTTSYGRVQEYMLPRSSEVEMQMPALRATAEVTYSDYALNTNLPDSVFAP